MAYVGNVFRLDMLGILISAALVGWLACMIYRDVRRHRSSDVATIDAPSRQAGSVIAAFFTATAVFTFTAGMLETVSWVRISSFWYLPLMIAISAIVDQIVTVSVEARAAGESPCSNGCSDPADVRAVGAGIQATQATLLAVLHEMRFDLLTDATASLTPTGIRPGGPFSIGRRSIPACTKPGKESGRESVSGASI